MTVPEFLDCMNAGRTVASGSEAHRLMHRLSQEAIRITMRLNTEYHTPEEIVEIGRAHV